MADSDIVVAIPATIVAAIGAISKGNLGPEID